MAILDKLTNKYIFGRVLSPNADVSVEMCKFISHILESITEIKAYRKAYDAALEAAKRDKTQAHTFLPKEVYPAYRLGEFWFFLSQLLAISLHNLALEILRNTSRSATKFHAF